MTNSLTYWNPTFRRSHFDTLINRAFNDFLGATETSESPETTAASSWVPAMDIRETAEAITLLAELPGLTKKDIDISLEDGTLTLTGERHFTKNDGENYHRIERSFGQFTRTFKLPASVDAKRVEARFENGVLKIELPKSEETKPQKIDIK